jgi:hypothetical protein
MLQAANWHNHSTQAMFGQSQGCRHFELTIKKIKKKSTALPFHKHFAILQGLKKTGRQTASNDPLQACSSSFHLLDLGHTANTTPNVGAKETASNSKAGNSAPQPRNTGHSHYHLTSQPCPVTTSMYLHLHAATYYRLALHQPPALTLPPFAARRSFVALLINQRHGHQCVSVYVAAGM